MASDRVQKLEGFKGREKRLKKTVGACEGIPLPLDY